MADMMDEGKAVRLENLRAHKVVAVMVAEMVDLKAFSMAEELDHNVVEKKAVLLVAMSVS